MNSTLLIKTITMFLLSLTVALTASPASGEGAANVDATQSMEKPADPVLVEKYEYYTIKGKNEEELRSQMCLNGCTWSDGNKYDSMTDWNVKWDYGYRKSPNACSATSFRATIELTYHYPKWVRTGDISQALEKKWDTYMNRLIQHENGHRDLVLQAVEVLTREVDQLPPSQTCVEIDRAIRKMCRLHLRKLKDGSNAYDEETCHGTTQGAVFP